MQSYQSYKDSGLTWLDKVPEHWVFNKAKYIFNKMERPPRDEDGIVTAFRDGVVTLRTNRRTDGFTLALKEIGYQGIRKGDLVIHEMDAFAGAIGVSDSDGKSTPVYTVCTPKKEASTKFYAYLLKVMARNGFIQSLAKGIRERSSSFSFNVFQDLELPYFPLPEQQAIVDFLDRKTAQIDTLIEKKQRQIDLLQEQRTALINHAVTKGLNPNVKLKDSGVEWLGEIPSHWNFAKVKYVCNVKGRIGFRGYTTDDQVSEGEGALTLGATHITSNGVIDLSSPVFISWEKYYESPEIMVNQNDILVVQRGSTCGKVGFIENEIGQATINPSLVILKEHKINSKYLFYSLSSKLVEYQFSPTISKTAIPMLSQEQIGNFSILLPEESEQKKIVDFLDKQKIEFDKGTDIIIRQIEALQEYRMALISEAVTGKIDVRKDS